MLLPLDQEQTTLSGGQAPPSLLAQAGPWGP